METPSAPLLVHFPPCCPHSLGKLIEWKHEAEDLLDQWIECPHSLGKLIEWKQREKEGNKERMLTSPLAGETN